MKLTALHFDLKDIFDTSLFYSKGEEKAKKFYKDFYKSFHKDFLFDEFNPNDANILDNKFYTELLHILGLKKESKSSNTLKISNTKGSFYENIYSQLSKVHI